MGSYNHGNKNRIYGNLECIEPYFLDLHLSVFYPNIFPDFHTHQWFISKWKMFYFLDARPKYSNNFQNMFPIKFRDTNSEKQLFTERSKLIQIIKQLAENPINYWWQVLLLHLPELA